MAIGVSQLPAGFLQAMRDIEASGERPVAAPDTSVGCILDEAAVIGHFNLAWLDERTSSSEYPMALRSAALEASDCLDRAKGLWRLKLDRRRERLGALLDDRPRLAAVSGSANPPWDDERAEFLDAALRLDQAGPMELAKVPIGSLPALLDVSTWVQELGVIFPHPKEVRRELAARTRIAALAEVSRRFVGREAAVKRVDAFIDGPPTSEIQLLTVSGVGGIGKSALLARVLHDRLDPPADTNVLIVHIDFDRFGTGHTDPGRLDAELTRQLGLAVPELAPELDRLRQELRRARRRDAGSSLETATVSLETASIAHTDMTSELAYFFSNAQLSSRTLLIVLDTLEELQAHSESALTNLAEWLEALRTRSGFSDLRVIAGGRADVSFPPNFRHSKPLVLDELGRMPALRLLRHLQLGKAQAQAVYDRYGGNPLILRLAGRLAGAMGLDVLTGTGTEIDRRLDREVVQGMLYERVLGHVRDPRVRRLAYPGLVLRRVTADLIREVIAPLCLDPPLALGEETVLLDKLRREVWLVKSGESADEVEHRSDVRRVMMALMAKDRERGDEAQQIHWAAIRYLESGRRSLPARAVDEIIYHRFMIENDAMVPTLDKATAQHAAKVIGSSISEIPYHRQVWLKVALGRPVADRDVPLIPDYLQKAFVDRRGPELVAQEKFDQAIALADTRPFAHGGLTDWEAASLDAVGRWEELAVRALGSLGEAPIRDGTAWLERTTLIALSFYRAGDLERARSIAGSHLRQAERAEETSALARLRCAHVEARSAMQLGRPVESRISLTTADLLRDDALAFEHLRYLQATGLIGRQLFRPTHQQFLPSLDWLEQLLAIGGSTISAALSPLVEEFRDLDPRRVTTGRLLGHFGTKFRDALFEPFLQRQLGPDLQMHVGSVIERPELRPALRGALMQSVAVQARPNSAVYQEIVSEMARKLPLVPYDLSQGLTNTPQQERIFATTLIAFADRCQSLSLLTAIISDLGKGIESVERVTSAVYRWNTLIERSMMSKFSID